MFCARKPFQSTCGVLQPLWQGRAWKVGPQSRQGRREGARAGVLVGCKLQVVQLIVISADGTRAP